LTKHTGLQSVVAFDCLIEIPGGLFHGWTKMWIQRANLSRDVVGFHCRLDCPTASMPKHQQNANLQDCNSILQAGNDLRRHHISRNTCDEDMTDCLVKH